jgi:hypothetical protein
MSVFFNGRKITTPATASRVNDDAMRNQNLSVGNVVALLGVAAGGKPKTALRYGSPQQAQAELVSGELLDAVLKAFDPSSETGGPDLVVAYRVNPATQAILALNNSVPTAVINLASTGYGLRENQTKVKIEAGTTVGQRVTVARGDLTYVGENLARNLLSIVYGGAQATATVTTTGTTLVLAAPAGTTVATIDLNTYTTVQALVDRINAVASFTAVTLDGNASQPTLNTLDYVTAQSVKTISNITGNLQAVVDWFNSNAEPLVTATRVAGQGTVPANIAYTYLAGATEGTPVTQDWTDAFTELQKTDVQWITPVTSDPAVHAMTDAHCKFMTDTARKERRAICGMALGTTDAQAIAAAKLLNSDRTSLVHIGHYDYDASGALVLYAPYQSAARIAGGFAGVNPGTPLTNKNFKCRGLERELRIPTDTDPLIDGGVLCIGNTDQGYKVIKSISTWLLNTNYNKVEQSCGVAVDFAIRNVREALDVLRGQKGTPILLSRAVSIAESTLRELAKAEPVGPGVLVGDADSPAYRNITATLVGDVVQVSFEASPVIPANYILVTMYAVPFTGTATA